MRKIFKYHLDYTKVRQNVKVPVGARILSVGMQGRWARLWVEIDDTVTQMVDREILIIPTGMELPKDLDKGRRFLGRINVLDDKLIFHVWE